MTKSWKWLRFGTLLCLLPMAVPGSLAGALHNNLPPDAAEALRAPEKVVLYSLEPVAPPGEKTNNFNGYKILGHVDLVQDQAVKAIVELKSVVSAWDGVVAECFEPRHALRVTAGNHTYDFLLCYECHQLEVYRDGKSIASLGATGSPKVLNGLLSAANIPLPR